MAALQNVVFTHLYINNNLVAPGNLNECRLRVVEDRRFFDIALSENSIFEIDIDESLSEFRYGKLEPELDKSPILDFKFATASIPLWVEGFLPSCKGVVYRISVTMKMKKTHGKYSDFVNLLLSWVPRMQSKSLDNEEAVIVWKERSATLLNRVVDGVNFRNALFGRFSVEDLKRLGDDSRWLSDTHVTLAVRDYFEDCSRRKVWGDLTIQLLDTTFWIRLSENPEKFSKRQREREKLLECDFVVMPMHVTNHWRLAVIEKPGGILEGNVVLHILDSLRTNTEAKYESDQLEKILLKYFKGKKFSGGRVRTNVPQVPQQPNYKDCACYTVFFAKSFFYNPQATMNLIKNPPSAADLTSQWGLKGKDTTFIRREIRTTLLRYISKGDASVEYV